MKAVSFAVTSRCVQTVEEYGDQQREGIVRSVSVRGGPAVLTGDVALRGAVALRAVRAAESLKSRLVRSP
jgi:hypothetical protein